MTKVLLYQHGGSFNHGCEALATTISAEVKRVIPGAEVSLCSHHADEDLRYNIKTIDNIRQNTRWLRRGTWPYFYYQIDKRLFNSYALQNKIMIDKPCLEMAEESDICIAIGGDNYCYNKGKAYWPSERVIRKMHPAKKMMLWGCSINPEEIPGELIDHLKLFDKITARDRFTYDALIKAGYPQKDITLVADPAFLLEPDMTVSLASNMTPGKFVGINLSPMILNYAADRNKVVASIQTLVHHILDTTDLGVYFIAHVRLPYTDDLDVLRPLYEEFKSTGRVALTDDLDLNCRQLKGIISQSRFYIGARTHSVIAAYSTGVPAIALGYSVKARGIANDLLGSWEDTVLPVQTLEDEQGLVKAFDYLAQNEDRFKKALVENVPGYKEQARKSGEVLRQLYEQ